MPLATPSAHADELDVSLVGDARALFAMAPEWDALVDGGPGAVFRSPSWLLSWWEAYGDRSGRRLRTYTLRWRGRLVGVLPAYRARARFGGPELRLLGDGAAASDHLGPVVAPELRAAVLEALAAALVDGEHALCFEGLAEEEDFCAALEKASHRRGAACEIEPWLPAAYLSLPHDFDVWLDGLPGGVGSQLRRRRRWLSACSGYALDVAEGPDLIPALETLDRLHNARWRSEGGPDGVRSAADRYFLRASASRLAAERRARVFLLSVEGHAVAALYGVERGKSFSYYQSGLDPAWRARSVGTVVLTAAIADAWRRGLLEFDFLRGGERYKDIYASSRRQVLRVVVTSGTRARTGRIMEQLATRARRALSANLGPSTVDWARRMRARARGGGFQRTSHRRGTGART